MNLKYRRLDYQYAHDLPEQWSEEDDIEELAEAAAEDYWRNHDGWEARWPLTFEILLPNEEVLGTCSVSLDMEPVFDATTHNVKVTGTLRQGAARCRISNGASRRLAATCPSRPTC